MTPPSSSRAPEPGSPETRYFRVAERPKRRFLLTAGVTTWEVSSGVGTTSVVDTAGLRDALGIAAGGSRNDEQHCRSRAIELFESGDREHWVQYPFGGTATNEEVLGRAAGPSTGS
jgi:hypothetical protein